MDYGNSALQLCLQQIMQQVCIAVRAAQDDQQVACHRQVTHKNTNAAAQNAPQLSNTDSYLGSKLGL